MRKKILIIEDEGILSNALRAGLKKEGYRVTLIGDGQKGLLFIKKEKPDLILLDILTPGMSGFEVMENMSKDAEIKDIPVIVISNSGQPVEISRAFKLGAKDYFVKAELDPEEIVAKVIKQVGRSEVNKII